MAEVIVITVKISCIQALNFVILLIIILEARYKLSILLKMIYDLKHFLGLEWLYDLM